MGGWTTEWEFARTKFLVVAISSTEKEAEGLDLNGFVSIVDIVNTKDEPHEVMWGR